jgi:PhnB protein
MSSKVKPIPDGYTAVTPYLTIKDAANAIDFYKKAFNATEKFRMTAPDNKIAHAEIMIGNATIMLSDEFPTMGAKGPQTFGGTPVGIMLYVDDVDSVAERAVKAGAKLQQPVEDKFYGDRLGTLEDPYGHRWFIATHIEDVSPDEVKRRAEEAMKKAK